MKFSMKTLLMGSKLQPAKINRGELTLLFSFFMSGVAALAYQICWNRSLYGAVGVDIDSVTLIVSCFMLGIGVGGMLGGWVADRFPAHRIPAYIAIEIALAIFGVISLRAIDIVSANMTWVANAGTVATGFVVFITLLVPTVLMGMTLPILSVAFEATSKNIGASVGSLYFANTLGAAFGAYLVPFHLFPHFDLDQTVFFAACTNVTIAIVATLSLRNAASEEIK
jgi:predicted membrane-bound spermidine synthase